VKLFYSLLALLFMSVAASGQTAALRGQVTDQNGAVVAGARVTLHAPAGFVKTASTDNSGSYSFSALPSGDYAVVPESP
jgi:protocatechuate 3,4-dioxygenase beta subunit